MSKSLGQCRFYKITNFRIKLVHPSQTTNSDNYFLKILLDMEKKVQIADYMINQKLLAMLHE